MDIDPLDSGTCTTVGATASPTETNNNGQQHHSNLSKLQHQHGHEQQQQNQRATTQHDPDPLFPFFRKRPRHQDDPFFSEGTYEYKAAWLKLTDEDAYLPEMELYRSDHGSLEESSTTHSSRTHLQTCHLGQCHGELTFSTPTAYEHHYETNHRHICRSCEKIFPGAKWLELHLNEVHDIMVKIRREQGQKTYRCFVDGCERVCSTHQKRRRHLIDKHLYPKLFNFAIVFTGVIPMAQRVQNAKREQALLVARAASSPSSHHINQNRRRSSIMSAESIEDMMDLDRFTNPLSSAHSDKPVSSTAKYPPPSTSLSSMDIDTTCQSSVSTRSGHGAKPKKMAATASTEPHGDRQMAFQQYRQPASAPVQYRHYHHHHHQSQGRRSSKDERSSTMDVEGTNPGSINTTSIPSKSIAAPCPPSPTAATSRSDNTFAMDMDQLQQSMTRLMIPRQVANKIKHPPNKQ